MNDNQKQISGSENLDARVEAALGLAMRACYPNGGDNRRALYLALVNAIHELAPDRAAEKVAG